jgi:hypothetical protein
MRHDGLKRVDNLLIELDAAPANDLPHALAHGLSSAIRPVVRQRVERIGHRHDTARDRDVVAGELLGVPGAVPPFVMLTAR